MRLSCCAYSYRSELTGGTMSLESFLETCVGVGFDGVELTQYYFPDESPAFLNQVKRRAACRGLDVTGTAVGGNFSQMDPDGRARQIAHVCDWLEKSMRLGAPVLRVFAGGCPDGIDRSVAQGWVHEGLARCAERAEECGVMLALETHGGLTSDAAGVLNLLEPFAANPWVGLNLDFGNLTGDIYGQYRKLAPHAVATHAKTSVRQGEERELIDYRRVVRIMDEAGYRGPIAIEYEGADEAVQGVPRFAAYLRGCMVDA